MNSSHRHRRPRKIRRTGRHAKPSPVQNVAGTACKAAPVVATSEMSPELLPSLLSTVRFRRRRTRKEKILKLRKSLAAASSETDRARFRTKLHRQGLVSPGTPLLKAE